MSPSDALQILFWIAFGIFAGWWLFFGYWRLRSEIKRRSEGEAPLRSSREVIWRDPGSISAAELEAGPCGSRGAPAAPFHFVEEHDTGSQPCVSIRDAAGQVWRVKWGQEVHTETFGTRLAWALGYFAEPTYFISSGSIEGTPDLRRAKECIDEHRRFSDARFELSEPDVKRHFDAHGWAWHDNPFVGTHELNGLKILMMLMSNWDNKDVRDTARGSNTAIFEYPASGSTAAEARYLIIDWGAALGAWGATVLKRGRWDPEAFAAQNAQFITGVEGDLVQFGYQGQRTADLTANITRADVAWFVRVAERATDDHLRAALRASGATNEETDLFTAALRARLDQLRNASRPSAPN
ncbi:MAG: hypothetical protein K2Y23_25115 [Cyanobacteria bacterium]|nr:hypothetical protein [Cyanobacteriota bacterium]